MDAESSPLRLLMVTGIFPPDLGGPASYVPRMAAALMARGRKVEVVCLSDRTDHDDSPLPFPVRRIRRGIFFPFRLVATTFAVWRAACRNDLVYINGLSSEAALGALLAGRRAVHKIVGDYAWERATSKDWYHGTIDEYQVAPKNLMLRFSDAVRSWPHFFAHGIIVPSQYLARIVRGWGVRPEKVRVIYNAIAEDRCTKVPKPKLPPWPGKTLITVCRLVRWKGVDALINLLPKLPTTRLVIAGDGYIREELKALVRTCGVADRVLFLGDVPHQDVAEYLAQSDAFVLNSSYEGLPHVVLEAMSACTPVIATDVGGTGEAVIPDRTGLLIPPGNPDALQKAIERLWNEPELGARLTREAAVVLADRFVFEAMLAATDEALAEAAGRRNGTTPEAQRTKGGHAEKVSR